MTTILEGEVLTLTAVMAPGKGCSGHMGDIPGGMAYEDQHGYLWCIACAKHMTSCADEMCGHPAAAYAEPGPANDDQGGRCEHGSPCDFECAASLMSDEGDSLTWDELWGDWDDQGDEEC